MTSKGWIALSEYASKYQVSVSTLRRRIKRANVEVELIHGKYWFKDLPLSEHNPKSAGREEQVSIAPEHEIRTEPNQDGLESLSQASLNTNRPPTPSSDSDASIFTVTNDLLGELKKAYMQVLQEKEEQILLLKTEIDDLRTLVHVLEADNNRLRSENKNQNTNSMQKVTMPVSESSVSDLPTFASSESWLELD